MNKSSQYFQFPALELLHCGQEKCGPSEFHSHSTWNCYLIHIVLSGSGTLYFNGMTLPMHKGQAYFLFPGDSAGHTSSAETPWTYAWIGFVGTHAFEIARRLDLNRDFPCYQLRDIDYVHSLVDEILNLAVDERRNSLLAIGNLLKIASMMEKDKATIWETSNNHYKYLEKAMNYIHTHLEHRLSVPEIASNIGLCRSHLYRVFKSNLGVSVSDYILRARVDLALELLNKNQVDMMDIALSCGFSDIEHMRRAFRKVTGETPRQYCVRRQISIKNGYDYTENVEEGF